jgi:predicted HTH transcriptional regulator
MPTLCQLYANFMPTLCQLNNTAILLFAKDTQEFFSQLKIRAGRLKGVDGLDFIDMKLLEGTIPELRE